MSLSINQYAGDGVTVQFPVTFTYLDKTHVEVRVDGVLTTAFTWANPGMIQMNTAPAAGKVVDIRRNTPKNVRLVNFQDASTLTAGDLNTDGNQDFNLVQEVLDTVGNAIGLQPDGTMDALSKRIKNVADPTVAQDAATKNYVDSVTGAGQAALAAASASAAAASSASAATSATSASGYASAALTSENNAAVSAASAANASSNRDSLTNFIRPSLDGNFRDLYRSGWLPSGFNQQWGGAQWGNLPDGSFGSVATGNIQDDSFAAVGNTALQTFISTAFRLSENMTNPIFWVKAYKVGNPTDTFGFAVYSDNGSGSPSAIVGTGVGITCKLLTSKSDGEWYAIQPTPGILTAGTQYHLVANRSGALDSVNYPSWKCTASRRYPHGYQNVGNATPTWTAGTGVAQCFLIQNPAANSLLQSGGMFDYKLSFAAGSLQDQQRSVAQPLMNFYDGKNCTVLYRGTYSANSAILDFAYGIDHDRITLNINGSGFPVLTIYRSDRTAYTVTGTGSVATGNHDVGFKVRTVGDGADYATLYVDGVSVGTPLTAQTFTMDKALRDLGTARLGDGFGLTPTWTQDMQMTSLPSAQGWTWTGSLPASEASAMSIQNGKLYQNATGYASTNDGYYQKTTAFANATGWAVTWKVRAATNSNNVSQSACAVYVGDGTKTLQVLIQEYYVEVYGSASIFKVQGDFKTQEHVFHLTGKGSDFFLYIDGKLAMDGTGQLTATTATNALRFGDFSGGAGENADAVWSYVKYYQGGMVVPTAATGTCSEFAHWSGDKSALLPTLWNSGTPVSVKAACGVARNYQSDPVVQKEFRSGIAYCPTTTSSSNVAIPELEGFTLGSDLTVMTNAPQSNSAAGNVINLALRVDGSIRQSQVQTAAPGNNYVVDLVSQQSVKLPVGLHKAEAVWYSGAGTATCGIQRSLYVEARS